MGWLISLVFILFIGGCCCVVVPSFLLFRGELSVTGHGKFKLLFSEETSLSPSEEVDVWRQFERKENIFFVPV